LSEHVEIIITRDGKKFRVSQVPGVGVNLSETLTLAGARHIAAEIEKRARARNWTVTVIEKE
jgi:hypothetical protein